jgi:hypothetical protein
LNPWRFSFAAARLQIAMRRKASNPMHLDVKASKASFFINNREFDEGIAQR